MGSQMVSEVLLRVRLCVSFCSELQCERCNFTPTQGTTHTRTVTVSRALGCAHMLLLHTQRRPMQRTLSSSFRSGGEEEEEEGRGRGGPEGSSETETQQVEMMKQQLQKEERFPLNPSTHSCGLIRICFTVRKAGFILLLWSTVHRHWPATRNWFIVL